MSASGGPWRSQRTSPRHRQRCPTPTPALTTVPGLPAARTEGHRSPRRQLDREVAGKRRSSLTVTATGGNPTAAGPPLLTGAGAGLAAPTAASACLRAVPPQQVSLASDIGVATATAVFTGSDNYLTPAAPSADCSQRCSP